MTSHVWKAGLVVALLAGLASEAAAQGRPGGRGPGGGGGMGSMGSGGRCGGAMNSSLQGTRSASMNSPQQSTANSIRAYQQQVAMMAYQSQLQAAIYQQRAAQMSPGTVMVSLATPPRQGASAAREYSSVWNTEYAVEPPVRTVTPSKGPVVLAVNPPMHAAYMVASAASLEKKIQEYIAAGEVVLLDSPLSVYIEATVRGFAYVRPTEGRYKGQFFVVEDRYVK